MNDLNLIHDCLYNILCTIDDICREEKITYFLGYGTAIGAVREHDFIPWDDDMDIHVREEDYNKFRQAMKEKLPEHMHLIEPADFAPHFFDFTIRIYDDRYPIRKSTAEDNFYGNLQNYVGTDVFILCKAGNNKLKRKLFLLKTKILYGMGMAHRHHIDKSGYTFVQKLQTFILTCIGKFFSAESICDRWFHLIKKYEHENCAYLFNANAPLNYHKMIPSRIYKGASKAYIRNRKFPVSSGYDEELTLFYGDYMHPPKDITTYNQHMEEEGKKEQLRRWEKATQKNQDTEN